MKFSNGDRVEVHIKSIDRWRSATILTTYPGHGGHMVITDGGQRLHAKRGDLRATTHYTPGETVEVRSKEGSFWVAGIFERWVDDTHQQTLVRDGSPWPDTVTADPFHVSNIRHKAPTPDPHGTAYQGEVGDHQPHSDSVGALTPLELDTLRLRPLPPLDGASIIPPMGPITGSTLKYGHVAKTDELSNLDGEHIRITDTARETVATMRESLKEFTNRVSMLGTLTEAGSIARYEKARTDMSNKYGVSYKEQSRYLDTLECFVQAGITPEVLNGYVAALGRFNAYGFTPEVLERLTADKLRENYTITPNQRDSKIPNITAEYRGTR